MGKLDDAFNTGKHIREQNAKLKELQTLFDPSEFRAALDAAGGSAEVERNIRGGHSSALRVEQILKAREKNRVTSEQNQLKKAGALSLLGSKQNIARGRQRLLANLGKLGVRGADAGRTLSSFESGALTRLQGQAFGQTFKAQQFAANIRQQQISNQLALKQIIAGTPQKQREESTGVKIATGALKAGLGVAFGPGGS